MEEEIFKLISIILLTMLKFIAGPTLGYAAKYNYITSVLITVVGMMCSVFLFTFLGRYLRERIINKYFKRKNIFSKRSRNFVRIWRRYGVTGVAFLTPLIFTPIGGTLMLASTGTEKSKILLYMLCSGTLWAFILTGLVYIFGDALLQFIT